MPDLYQLRKNGRASALLGLAFGVLILAVAGAVVLKFAGVLSSAPKLTVLLPANGSVVADQSPVKYRDVTVGTVISTGGADAQGHPEVTIRLDPAYAHDLPGNTVATVGPVSIFGNQYVQLVSGPGGIAPTAGAVIPALNVDQTPSLENTFTNLYDLLTQIDPAKLNAGLSSISGALAGEGKPLGRTLVRANTYLASMVQLWPTMVRDLDRLAVVSSSLTGDAPALFGILRNSAVTAATLTSKESAFRSLMGNGAALSQQVSSLLESTAAPYHDTILGAVSLLRALSQGPDLVLRMLTGIDTFARAWAPVLHTGRPTIAVDPIRVHKPADLALAIIAGGPDVARMLNSGIHPGFANPTPYAGCPASLCAGGRR